MQIGNRKIDSRSIELDGVNRRDYPDFADAYFSYAEFEDGTELSDSELELLTEEYADVVNQLAHERLY